MRYFNTILNGKQIKDLDFLDEVVKYVILSLISTGVSLYALNLKRINICAPEGECAPIDRLYIRKLAVATGIISLVTTTFYFNNSKKYLCETEKKTKSLWLDYVSNLISFIPTLIRLYILLCMTSTDTITNEEIIAEQ